MPFQKRLIQILELALHDNCLAWDLGANGNYTQRYPINTEADRNFHQMLMEQALVQANSISD